MMGLRPLLGTLAIMLVTVTRVTADVVPYSLIIFTLKMEAIRSSEESILTRATRHHIPEDGSLHIYNLNGVSKRREYYSYRPGNRVPRNTHV
jgi:hypothetical protein